MWPYFHVLLEGHIRQVCCTCISFCTFSTGKTIEVSDSNEHSVNDSENFSEENEVEPLLKDSSVELNKFSYFNDVFKKVSNYFYR